MQPGSAFDLAALRGRITQVAPGASLDDHRAWIERMRSMSGATVAAGLGILALVIVATIVLCAIYLLLTRPTKPR